jgi:hypothetical protein
MSGKCLRTSGSGHKRCEDCPLPLPPPKLLVILVTSRLQPTPEHNKSRDGVAGETALGELDIREPRELMIVGRHLARLGDGGSKFFGTADEITGKLRKKASAAAAAGRKLQRNRRNDTSPEATGHAQYRAH